MAGPWGLYKPQDAPDVPTPEAAPSGPGPWDVHKETETPSSWRVGAQSLVKGAANIPDDVYNAGIDLWNLTKIAYGMGAYAIGRNDIGDNIMMTSHEDPVKNALGRMGVIRPEFEPHTTWQRILDKGVQAGVLLAASPGKSGAQYAKQVALGTTATFAGAGTEEVTGSPVAGIAVSILTPLALRHATSGLVTASFAKSRLAANEVASKTLKEGIEKGFTTIPGDIKPTFWINRATSFGDPQAVQRSVQIRNQVIANRIANADLKLSVKDYINEDEVMTLKANAGKVYEKVQALSPTAKRWFTSMDKARREAGLAWTEWTRNGARQAFHDYEKFKRIERHSLKALETISRKAGQPELTKELVDARTTIAKAYDVLDALNPGAGNLDPVKLKNLWMHGRPLTEGLELIARWTSAFGRTMREASSIPNPNVNAYASFAGTTMGAIRTPARAVLMRPGVQNALAGQYPGLRQTMNIGAPGALAIAEDIE